MTLLLGLGSGCAPHANADARHPVIVPTGHLEPVSSHSDGRVVTTREGTVYEDATAGFDVTAPPAWSARARFDGDSSGPPPAGDLRARFTDQNGCVIDIAVEPAGTDEKTLRASILRGRELFFFASIDEPRPVIAAGTIWTATLTPADPSRIDVGFWITGKASRIVRVEGRFPVGLVAECKSRLDDLVRSMRPHATSGEAAPDPELRTSSP